MKHKLYMAAGIALALASVWIGSWFIGGLPKNNWAEFPASMTAICGCLGGYWLFWMGITKC